jgi:hypothetical protein
MLMTSPSHLGPLLFILTLLAGTFGLSWRATPRPGSTAPDPSPSPGPSPGPGPGPDEAESAPTGVLGGGITTGAGRSGSGS